jgi:hypothetical protein
MEEYAVADKLVGRRSGARKKVDQYYNVEFLSDGLGGTHRLKICNKSTNSMCLLVKKNLDILPRLKVGDTLKMIYYPTNSVYPCVHLGAVIRHITKKDKGRFNGHYLVDFEILDRRD